MSRTRIVRLVAATAVAVAATAVANPVTSSQAASPGTQYYRATPLCGNGGSHHMQCLAMRLVPVAASTPGARPAQVHAGYQSGPAGGFTPGALAPAYGIDADAPTSQVVAVVDAYDDPRALGDLDTFDAQYGLPAETVTSFRKVSQSGSTSALPPPDQAWAGEESLDLDAVRGLCHRCRILLVEAASDADDDLAVAEDEAVALGATVVSNSFGEAEQTTIPTGVAAAFDHPGVVIAAGSGDEGMDSWDAFDAGGVSSNAPFYPAALSTVVAVGGTTLELKSSGRRATEVVWNENGIDDLFGFILGPLGATGGGCSTVTAAPSWQAATVGYPGAGCAGRRLSADIAAVADPFTGFDVYDSYDGSGWRMVGGTSLSTPLIAAMWALAGGPRGLRYPAASLYGHSRSDTSPTLFDVTSGGNGFCGGDTADGCVAVWGQSPNTFGAGYLDCAFLPDSETHAPGTRECDAAAGFDGPSGVGTPTGTQPFVPLDPTMRVKQPAAVRHGASAKFTARKSTDPYPSGAFTSYSWAWGDGTTTTVGTATVTHTWAAPGSRVVTLTGTDTFGRSSSTTFTVLVS